MMFYMFWCNCFKKLEFTEKFYANSAITLKFYLKVLISVEFKVNMLRGHVLMSLNGSSFK